MDKEKQELMGAADLFWTRYASALYERSSEEEVRRSTALARDGFIAGAQLPDIFLTLTAAAFKAHYFASLHETAAQADERLNKILIKIYDPSGDHDGGNALPLQVSGVLTTLTQMAKKRGETANGNATVQADYEKTLKVINHMLPKAFADKLLQPEINYCLQHNDFPDVRIKQVVAKGTVAESVEKGKF